MYSNRAALALTLALLLCAAPASAQTIPAQGPTPAVASVAAASATSVGFTDFYRRAFTYWRAPGLDSTRCPSGPVAAYDDAKVRAMSATAVAYINGCTWWFGDEFLGLDIVTQCDVATHELGHLLGLADGLGDPRDPLGVMGSPAVNPSCGEIAQRRATVARKRLAARWAAYTAARAERAAAVKHRAPCLRRALSAPTSRQRMRAASRCRVAFTLPALLPRPSGAPID